MGKRHKNSQSNAKTPSPPQASLPRPISRQKKWFFRAAILLLPIVSILLLEWVLRIAGAGYNPDFFLLRTGQNGQTYLVDNPTFSLRFFPPKLARWPGSINIVTPKPPGVKRIFIFGESAAMGDPQPAYGASRYLEVLLRQRFPSQTFEVVNLGITAINSHVILPIAREVAARGQGDVWIIYMGNNEMVGPFGAATVFGSRAPPLWAARLNLAIQKWRGGQLAVSLLRNLGAKSAHDKAWDGMHMFQQNQIAPDDQRRETVYRNFEGNLRDILVAGLDSGAQIILSTVAVNLRDCPPFASISETDQPAEKTQQFHEVFNAAVEFESASNYATAAPLFEKAVALDSSFAEGHFRLGECLTSLNELKEARDQFQLACDDDGLPFRADSHINSMIREQAGKSRNPRLLFCDAESSINSASPTQTVGDDLFFEHVHFNFDGNYRLALSWAETLRPALASGPDSTLTNRWPSQQECERQLGLTDFNRVAVLQTVIRRMETPPLSSQFNNRERLLRLKEQDEVVQARLRQPDALNQARAAIEADLAKSPDDHYLYEGLGNILESTGDYSEAAAAYRKSVELQPQEFYSRLRLGRVLDLQGEYPKANEVLKQAMILRPFLPDAWYELANSQMLAGDYETAVSNFVEACNLQPNDPKNQYALCRCRGKLSARQNRHDLAILQYRQAIEVLPSNWEAHFELGGELDAANQLNEAAQEFATAVRLNPDYSRTHFDYAVVLAKLNRLDEAQNELETTIHLEPGNKIAQTYLAQIESLKKPVP